MFDHLDMMTWTLRAILFCMINVLKRGAPICVHLAALRTIQKPFSFYIGKLFRQLFYTIPLITFSCV